MREFLKKSLLLIPLLAIGFLAGPHSALAWFGDIETSEEAAITAGIVDFRLTKQAFEGRVGKEYDGELKTVVVAVPEDESMDMQYAVGIASSSLICDQFTVQVKLNENVVYSGPVSGFTAATTTDFGTWGFEFDLPTGAAVTEGDTCGANFVFQAWSADASSTAVAGFYDIETFAVTLHARTIVLNEVLANPDPNAAYPANREFIELKNNGNAPVDVAGWELSEISGSSEVRRPIVASGATASQMLAVGGTTVIPPGGYLVLIFGNNTSFLNNSGDTLRLYDTPMTNSLVDQYAYTSSQLGKSDARLPDGIGAWVDPVPTPGAANAEEAVDAVITDDSSAAEAAESDPMLASEDSEGSAEEPEATSTDPAAADPAETGEDEQAAGAGDGEPSLEDDEAADVAESESGPASADAAEEAPETEEAAKTEPPAESESEENVEGVADASAEEAAGAGADVGAADTGTLNEG